MISFEWRLPLRMLKAIGKIIIWAVGFVIGCLLLAELLAYFLKDTL